MDLDEREAVADSPKFASQVGGYHESLIAFAIEVEGTSKNEKEKTAQNTSAMMHLGGDVENIEILLDKEGRTTRLIDLMPEYPRHK